MEGLHHDTVLDVPHSVTEEEDPMPATEKKNGADQQKQDNTGDTSLDNDAQKTIGAPLEKDGPGNMFSGEDSEVTESVAEKTDVLEELQVEDETLDPSLDDASAETNEPPLLEDGVPSTASNEEPTSPENEETGEPSFGNERQETNEMPPPDEDTERMVHEEEIALYSEKTEEDSEPSTSDKSPEINESTPTTSSSDNDLEADTLIQSLAEDGDDAMVSNEEETLRSEKSENADKTQLNEKIIPISKMREQIAAYLIESKTQIPHFYLQYEINAGPLLDARFAINKKFSEQPPELGGVNVTINDLVLKASAEAIRSVPEINASWKGDHIKQHGAVHLAFSVAVEDGLITPVIRDAETKHLRDLSVETKKLISKARTQKLSPEEMSGSTFTITNLGMYGVDFFSNIINPPNAAILSVGATKTKPIVDDLGRIVSGRRMMLGLSCDQRVVDGAIGASYLKALAEILESPTLMLV